MKKQTKIMIIVHGGAGSKPVSKANLRELQSAIKAGFCLLKGGASCIDAVETAIRVMEDSGRFNAGRGSWPQLDGRCRMDASIMEGRDLNAGAVACVEDVRNPIRLARQILESTPHVLMTGQGAIQLAKFFKIDKKLFPTKKSLKTLSEALMKKDDPIVRLYHSVYGHETVGAIALDRTGNLSAGASTGGISSMLPGRIGDTSLVGSGVYADNSAGAVSMTGMGETIIRAGLAKEISCHLENGIPPQKALEKALKRLLTRIQGEAGAIALTRKGEFAIMHTTPVMCAGYQMEGKRSVVGVRFQQVR